MAIFHANEVTAARSSSPAARERAAAHNNERAEHILHQWPTYRGLFWKVVPHPPQVETETAAARVTSGSDAADLQRPVAVHQPAR